MRYDKGRLLFSPSDLIRYLASPFSSWMDHFHLLNPGVYEPDGDTEEQKLIAQTGNQHEANIIAAVRKSTPGLVEIGGAGFEQARRRTQEAVNNRAQVIYQAALGDARFQGVADFLILEDGRYQVWDAKLARSPKPYFPVQLCCYAEMFAETAQQPLPATIGVILGTGERAAFPIEDFLYYYRRLRSEFLTLHDGFTGVLADRPEPLPRADHGRWQSHADAWFALRDHLSGVANITVGQIKKLHAAGITTVRTLAQSSGRLVPRLAEGTLATLAAQARLQIQTRDERIATPDAPPKFEVLHPAADGRVRGLAALPDTDAADVFFDMEGYPLTAGGLEYLFGAWLLDLQTSEYQFRDWWAHDREEEQRAFEGFLDWVYARWRNHPGMHIYHYAAYEVSALRRLSTQHDTRQEQVDTLLRHHVFVDLYQIVCHGVRIGEASYSIKSVEKLYRPGRTTEVATATDSIVQYARWMESRQSGHWQQSQILRGIRDYNQDDCLSTAELADWLRSIAVTHGIETGLSVPPAIPEEPRPLKPEVAARLALAAELAARPDAISQVLSSLVDFHRREEKPMWWRMFDRDVMTAQALRDDPCCIQGVTAEGEPQDIKISKVQTYRFDPQQDCKLRAGDECNVMFCGDLKTKFTLHGIDYNRGELRLKKSRKKLIEECGGAFPRSGSLLRYEHVDKYSIPGALAAVARQHLENQLNPAAAALLRRTAPVLTPHSAEETVQEAAIRISGSMRGGCLVIQGPPGTGKTFTAATMIRALVAAGQRVGVVSNSHKAITNLLEACGDVVRAAGGRLQGIKVGGVGDGCLFDQNPDFAHIKEAKKAREAFTAGVVGGTAWLFTRPEWQDALDFLFIDEAGQVSLANTVAMTGSTRNLVLLGDQMQLEQPIQGVHPGDAGLSGLQYALKDQAASRPDAPVFHAVVPQDAGLFLGESRRMHPSVCRFISDSIYDGRLRSHSDCARQRIFARQPAHGSSLPEHGLVFAGVEHEGNSQQSDEEVERVQRLYNDLLGRSYTGADGITKQLSLEDFLFLAPYNAQVRALESALPENARVGSVDRFQGQQAPVCVLSLCSSYGEYGARGLGFILDRNRINVALSRAQCLAIVVADQRIAGAPASSLHEMTLINLLCKVLEQGTHVEMGEPREVLV